MKDSLIRALDPQLLKKRAETALRGGQHRQALDLARTLFESAPEPAHRELFVRASLDEAECLISASKQKEAGPIASEIFTLVDTPQQQCRLAEVLSQCGNLNWSWQLAQQVGEPALCSRILGHIADAAIRGRPLPAGLPMEFAGEKEAIARAFAELHSSKDDEVQASLQVIGLASPFLEWKILLRGLLCYYRRDDVKALENWRRLRPERLPSQIVAPLRMAIDGTFRAALPTEKRGRMQAILDGIEGDGVAARLQTVRRHLADERQLAHAFRQAEHVVLRLKENAPQLVSRLAGCFFWAIIHHGNPEDLHRYSRLFGPPAEDPDMNRLEALALEYRDCPHDAHKAWQLFEKSVAKHGAKLPPGHADRNRSIVWKRMGDNAARVSDGRTRNVQPRSPFDLFEDSRRALKPDAETCYLRSLELAQDQLYVHQALVQRLLDVKKPGKALEAVHNLLAKFPDHAPSLEFAGDLCMQKSALSEAVDYFTRASRANPIDFGLRVKLGIAYATSAEKHAAAKRVHQAREAFSAALAVGVGGQTAQVLCQWAACEFRGGNPNRGDELVHQARNTLHPLAVAFTMLVYSTRLKLGKQLKARFDAEVTALLANAPDPAAATVFAGCAAMLRKVGAKYVGQKTHEKKVLAYLEKTKKGRFTEAQLQDVCAALTDLRATKLLQHFFKKGQREFPGNPRFYLAEVDYLVSLPNYRCSPMKARRLLEKTRTLASTLPPNERDRLLLDVQQREDAVNRLLPSISLPFGFPDVEEILGELTGGIDDDDWEDE